MTQFETFTFSPGNLQEEMNKTKELLVETLCAEGYLTARQGLEICKKWTIIVSKPSWLGILWSKLTGHKDPDEYIRMVVKACKHKNLEEVANGDSKDSTRETSTSSTNTEAGTSESDGSDSDDLPGQDSKAAG
jgi:hypothetical protein